ncbi:isocitrate lyase/PEP mutase family protein [Streptomyces sp. F001]|uniref:isocitrate lyase/PEP mutase family protein n=1 Tax=Streptomyces sp. F001 TaxID=1510026 RepID=UPI0013EE9D85|nr:isocitrate lyase/PEP mutase family protein [Streptomyces sp. F001]
MTTLREALGRNQPLIIPSIYDGMSALLVREAGFQAAYIGSYATGATKYGLPDIGYIGLEDMADQVRRLAPVAGVPIVVDGEGGWGNPLHVARAVQVLERAGAAAVHIEDHDFGKHLTMRPRVLPVDQAVEKIKAALDARTSDDFMVIARTDAAGVEGPAAAVDRALAYQDAGADGLFVASPQPLDDASYRRLRSEARVPVFAIDLPGQSAADHARQGADAVIYFALAHVAAKAGMEAAYKVLAKEASAVSLEANFGSLWDFDDFLGIAQAREAAMRHALIE